MAVKDLRAGVLTSDKITKAAFYRGQGLDWKTIARRVDVKNVNALMAAVKADGVPDNGIPPGSFGVMCILSAPRYHDLKSQLDMLGYEINTGLTALAERVALDRTVKKVMGA